VEKRRYDRHRGASEMEEGGAAGAKKKNRRKLYDAKGASDDPFHGAQGRFYSRQNREPLKKGERPQKTAKQLREKKKLAAVSLARTENNCSPLANAPKSFSQALRKEEKSPRKNDEKGPQKCRPEGVALTEKTEIAGTERKRKNARKYVL